jgi:plastocyanin
MSRTRIVIGLVALAVAAAIAASSALAGPTATPILKGTVGPGFTITLKKGTTKVKVLKAGKYKFVIADKASIHNFTLEQESGGKFEKDLTTVGFVGTKSTTVTLKKGKWKYYCTPHESTMFGFVTVK